MNKKSSLSEIQKVILGIIKDIDIFCKENNIEYYLMGGSALGAMRHHGFIPWDDDLDIFMTYDNYHRFLKLFELEISKNDRFSKYFLQKENTSDWPLYISRVCLTGTTLISNEFKYNMKQHHNVFVDIMCLYSAPENTIRRWFQYMAAQMIRVNALAKCNFPNKSKVKRIALAMSKVVVNQVSAPLLMQQVCKFENKNVKYVGHYFGRARFWNTSFPRSYLGKGRYVPFEDTMLPVFEFVEDYLVVRYGNDWMKMPSSKTRSQYPIHGNFVDLKKDYTKYLSKDRNHWININE